jgi:gluconolactonase
MEPEFPIDRFEVFANGLDHPKCIAFDRHGDLWAGGEAGQIYRVSETGKATTVAQLGSFCAGLAFSPAGVLFVCVPNVGIVRVEPNGACETFATHAGGHKIVCASFGVFDSAGNYYVTDSGNWKGNNGYLLRFRATDFDEAPSVSDSKKPPGEILAGPFGYVSGLALSADEKSLFMVESNTGRVMRFELQAGGTVGGATIYAENCGRFPNGLALATEGDLYVCCYASDEIWRIRPDRTLTLVAWDPFRLLLGGPTNMAFGRADLADLYVANLGRTTITRAAIGRKGHPLVAQRIKTKKRPRPLPI